MEENKNYGFKFNPDKQEKSFTDKNGTSKLEIEGILLTRVDARSSIVNEFKEQLNNIKVKKEEIIKEANKNIEIFKRFQEAARLNPNLTYAEFIKTLN